MSSQQQQQQQQQSETLIQQNVPAILEQTGQHDIRFKPSKKSQLWTSLYYIVPVIVIIGLFICHRIISNRNREDILNDAKVYERWRRQNGSRIYYFKGEENSGKEIQVKYEFVVEKKNISLVDGEATFEYIRRWNLSGEVMEDSSKMDFIKNHQYNLPNLTQEENFGTFRVSSYRSTLNQLRATNASSNNATSRATLGDFYLPIQTFKPYTIYLPDLLIYLTHDRISQSSDEVVLLSGSNGTNVQSEIKFWKSFPSERRTRVNLKSFSYEDFWRF